MRQAFFIGTSSTLVKIEFHILTLKFAKNAFLRSIHPEVSYKKEFLKILQNVQENRLQYSYFPVNFAKLSKKYILQKTCERLLPFSFILNISKRTSWKYTKILCEDSKE